MTRFEKIMLLAAAALLVLFIFSARSSFLVLGLWMLALGYAVGAFCFALRKAPGPGYALRLECAWPEPYTPSRRA